MKRLASLYLAAGALVLALGMASSSIAAGFGGPGFGPGPQLTPEQQQQAQEIFNQQYANTESARQQLYAKRAELNALLASPNPDKGRIQALSREIGELNGVLLGARSEVRNQLQQKGIPGDFYGRRGSWRDDDNWDRPRRGHRHSGYHGRMARGGCGCW